MRGVYQTPEQLRESVVQHVAWLIEDGIPVGVNALKRVGVCGKNARISAIVAELAANGDIPPERLDARRDRRLKTPRGTAKPREPVRATLPPPVSNHAPEIPTEARKPRTLWQEMAGLHWTPQRRAMFRRAT